MASVGSGSASRRTGRNDLPQASWSLARLSTCVQRLFPKPTPETAWIVGRCCILAKQKLPHGEFQAWKNKNFDRSATTLQIWQRIAGDMSLAEAKNAKNLDDLYGLYKCETNENRGFEAHGEENDEDQATLKRSGDWADDTHPGEYYTDEELLELLEPFDADYFAPPRSEKRKPIGKKINLTKADDAFSQKWSKRHRAFHNPPFVAGFMPQACQRIAEHGHGIALLQNSSSTQYWQSWVYPYCSSLLLIFGRLSFARPSGSEKHESRIRDMVLVSYDHKGEKNKEVLMKLADMGRGLFIDAKDFRYTR